MLNNDNATILLIKNFKTLFKNLMYINIILIMLKMEGGGRFLLVSFIKSLPPTSPWWVI